MDQKRENAAGNSAAQPRIKVSANGPYLVTGSVPLFEMIIVTDVTGTAIAWRKGQVYPLQPSYALCRCGRSAHKPFCDSAHARTHFDGRETAGHASFDDLAETIPGPGLAIADAPRLCAHAGFCDRAGGIWRLLAQSDSPEARRIAVEEAMDCPAGRLVALDEEGRPIEPDLAPSIGLVVKPHYHELGPLWVRGGIIIEAADGRLYEVRNRVTLCRCGRSAIKPFCDGHHTVLEG